MPTKLYIMLYTSAVIFHPTRQTYIKAVDILYRINTAEDFSDGLVRVKILCIK